MTRVAGADELLIAVRALGQQLEHMLGADDGEQEGLGVAVQRREEQPAARLHECCAGLDDGRRVGHVLEHFHAGQHLERRRLLGRQRLGGDFAVFDRRCLRLHGMQLGDLQRFGRQVDAQHLRAAARHRIRQDAAAATDIEHALAGQRHERLDPGQAQRVDLVQRAELAFRIPPPVGQFAEFGEFLRVDVAHRPMVCEHKKAPPKRGL
jgi:hypothetical protein